MDIYRQWIFKGGGLTFLWFFLNIDPVWTEAKASGVDSF